MTNQVWELVSRDTHSDTSRLRVEGGWLYRTLFYGPALAMNTVFVPKFLEPVGSSGMTVVHTNGLGEQSVVR
jgi:hypothetical protein